MDKQKEMTQERNKLSRQISALKKEYRELEESDMLICPHCATEENGEMPYDADENYEIWDCEECGERWRYKKYKPLKKAELKN